ncbi:MAG: formylglycine-generating enzyme family protein [Nitrospirae bacterium]|nr:formylglycine-generating enzyme family protein [Nitrospirota bacterium]
MVYYSSDKAKGALAALEEKKWKAIEELEKTMILVKGGCYQMGDTFGDGYEDEKPVHEVCIADFYIGKYEVTQTQWFAIMGDNPSEFNGCDNCPVENVSWVDVQDFINKLNNSPLTKGDRGLYRLPTEAEWEYAARSGGKKEKYAGSNSIGSVGWSGCYAKTHPVGQKKPNGLGLYDMSGNVWEWVQDYYDKNYYKNSPRNNPSGPNSGYERKGVVRGGSGSYPIHSSRSAKRQWYHHFTRRSDVGFRCARTP